LPVGWTPEKMRFIALPNIKILGGARFMAFAAGEGQGSPGGGKAGWDPVRRRPAQARR
jgi:hypothetical protein